MVAIISSVGRHAQRRSVQEFDSQGKADSDDWSMDMAGHATARIVSAESGSEAHMLCIRDPDMDASTVNPGPRPVWSCCAVMQAGGHA